MSSFLTRVFSRGAKYNNIGAGHDGDSDPLSSPAERRLKFSLRSVIICCVFVSIVCMIAGEVYLHYIITTTPGTFPFTSPVKSGTIGECSLSPYELLDVKHLLLDPTDFYVHSPVAGALVCFSRATSLLQYIIPNAVSVFHTCLALVAAFFVASEHLASRRIGVLLFELRNVLDCVDGRVARLLLWENLGGAVINTRGTFGYFLDGICDGTGCFFLYTACYLYLQKSHQLRKQGFKEGGHLEDDNNSCSSEDGDSYDWSQEDRGVNWNRRRRPARAVYKILTNSDSPPTTTTTTTAAAALVTTAAVVVPAVPTPKLFVAATTTATSPSSLSSPEEARERERRDVQNRGVEVDTVGRCASIGRNTPPLRQSYDPENVQGRAECDNFRAEESQAPKSAQSASERKCAREIQLSVLTYHSNEEATGDTGASRSPPSPLYGYKEPRAEVLVLVPRLALPERKSSGHSLALWFGIQALLGSLAWNRYVTAYGDLLEFSRDSRPEAQLFVAQIAHSPVFLTVAQIWRLVNVHVLNELLLLAVFLDVIKDFFVLCRFYGFVILLGLVAITELHLTEVTRQANLL